MWDNGSQAMAAGSLINLTFAHARSSPPAFFATGDLATQTIQNAPGDDGIALLGRGMFVITGQVATPLVNPGDDAIAFWDNVSAEIIPVTWASDSRPLGLGKTQLGTAIYSNWSWTSLGLPRWFGIKAQNLGPNPMSANGLIVMIAHWPADVLEMDIIY